MRRVRLMDWIAPSSAERSFTLWTPDSWMWSNSQPSKGLQVAPFPSCQMAVRSLRNGSLRLQSQENNSIKRIARSSLPFVPL